MSLCKYKDLFGKPNEGLHSYRIYNLAVVDIIATFILALLIQKFLFIDTSYYVILFLTFILGIFFHWLFCVETTLFKKLHYNK